MKTIATIITALVLSTSSHTFAESVDNFVSDVNARWASKKYSELKQTINHRLASYPGDTAALFLIMNYYLTIEYDLTRAQQYVSTCSNSIANINWTADPILKTYCQAMLWETMNPDEAIKHGVIFGMTSNQLEILHANFPTNHPLSEFIIRIGKTQYTEESEHAPPAGRGEAPRP